MPSLKIGKATLRIEVEGCIVCGTRWSHAWEVAKQVSVKIGNKEHIIEIFRCGDCAKGQLPMDALLTQPADNSESKEKMSCV